MGRVEIRLLGGFEARLAGQAPASLPRKARALLAYLAVTPGAIHPRDKLATLLWGERADALAQDSLRHALSAIRRAFAVSLLGDGQGVALAPDTADVDVARFQEAVSADTPESFERAADLYRGDLLEGLVVDEESFEAWLLVERERLRELVLEALARLLSHRTAIGDIERAVRAAQRLLALDPLQEAGHRALMRLYLRQSRRGAALRQYRECIAVLQRELSAEPEAETRQLYQQILLTRDAAPPDLASPGAEPAAAPASSHVVMPNAADPPLLGRATEQARMHTALTAAWRGEGRVLLIRGEAGIGKSRLIAELVSEADRRGGRIVVGHAYEGEQHLPFGPWVDAIRQALTMLGPAEVGRLSPAWRADLARLVPELDESRPPPPEGPGHHRRLFEAVVALVHRLAASHPLVLVLEDLHWADEPSLRLLVFLGHRLHGHRLLLLLSVRDEELVDAPGAASRLAELTADPGLTLTLGPLSRPDTTTLVQALGRVRPQPSALVALAERVWAASEGNPFLVVEATRSYRDGSDVETASGSSLPDRIHGLVAGRLRRASEPARAILAVAAVVARDAAFPLLQRAAGLGELEAAVAVEELVRRRLLREAGEGLALAHDGLRDVVYGPLLASRRKLLHRRVAETLDALYRDTLQPPWAALAGHYREAQEWAKAEAALVRLGEQSAQRYADEEAARAFAGALDLVSHLPVGGRDRATVEVLVSLAPSLYRLGRFQETVDRLETHRAAMERLDEPALSAPYAFWLGHAHGHVSGTREVVSWAHRAVDEATRADDRATLGKAQYLMCDRHFVADQFPQAIHYAQQAVAILEATDQRWWLGQAWYMLGGVYHFVGGFAASLDAERRAQAIGEILGDRRLQAYAAYVSGWTLAIRGDGAPGVDACRRGLALAPDALATAGARYRLGVAYLEDGRPAEGLPLLEAAVEDLRGMNIRHTLVSAVVSLGEACRALGQPTRARGLAEEARREAVAIRSPYRAAWADRLLGRLARTDGDLPTARHHLEEALRGFGDTHARFEVGRTHVDLGDLVEASGSRDTACVHFGLAREAFEACEAPVYVARAAARL
jgi:DNA-binding SARP family transcriptional activator